MLTEEQAPGSPFARRAAIAIGIGLLALALYLPRLGSADFVGDGEALDASIVRRMVQDRDWLFPGIDGEAPAPNAPLFYWEAAAVSELHGAVSEWSVRMPSAIAGALLVSLTVGCGARWVGLEPAVLGGLLLATLPVMLGQSRTGRCDMTAALLVASSLAVFGLAPEPMPRGHRWLFYALLGLTALSKAGAAMVVVSIIVVCSAISKEGWARLWALFDPAVLAFLAIGGSWAAAAIYRGEYHLLDEQLATENFRRFVEANVSDLSPRHIVGHLTTLLSVTMPWGLLLPVALQEFSTTDRGEGQRFLVGWLLGGFLVAIAAWKSPQCLLPLAPPLSLLVASWAWPRVAPALSQGEELPSPSLLAVWVVMTGLAAALVLAVAGRSDLVAAVRSAILEQPQVLPVLVVSLVPLGGLTVRAICSHSWAHAFWIGLSAIFIVLLAADIVDGPLTNSGSLRRFANDVDARTSDADRLFFFREPLPAVALYAERPIATLSETGEAPEAPFFLIVPESLAGELPESWRSAGTVVAAGDGRVFARRRMGIRLLRIRSVGRT